MKKTLGKIAGILGLAAALAGSATVSETTWPIKKSFNPTRKRQFKSKRTNQLHKMKRGGHTYIFG